MTENERQMHLVAYLLVPTCHHQGMWRHPYTDTGFFDRRFYQNLARTLEHGKFDMMFMPDVLTIYDRYGSSFDRTVQYGGQSAVSFDPLLILTTMACVTEHLGLAATLSATFFTPFALARSLATLDHMSGGRAAWNVVMSTSAAEAQNFGLDSLPGRQARYDRGDEVIELCMKLWESWDADALIVDKASGIYADPTKVHYLDFEGEWLKCRGPLTVPRSAQGRPVIMQAGASERGRQFAATWGEMVFTLQHSVDDMRAYYTDIRNRVADAGRNPDHCKILPAVQAVVGETESIAKERLEYMNELVSPEIGIATLSTHIGVDLSGYPLDLPVEDVQVEEGSRGSLEVVLQGTKAEGLTLGEAARRFATSELTPQLAGTPVQIADQLEEMFTSRACDGFIVTPTHLPGAWEDFSRAVVPELQRRGLFRTEYTGTTLRENLGLPALD